MKILLSVPPCLHRAVKQEGEPWLLRAAGLDTNKAHAPSFFVSSDPPDGHLGSAGGTLYLLREWYLQESAQQQHAASTAEDTAFLSWLESSAPARTIIHAGGHSRRLPSYAPLGKVLAPLPPMPGLRGQKPHHTLLTLQLPLLEEIFSAATHRPEQQQDKGENGRAKWRTMIVCGDVYLQHQLYPYWTHLRHELLREYSEGESQEAGEAADIVCFGIHSESEILSHHGVFFMRKETPTELEFMLQKPSLHTIAEQEGAHVYLMDIGIWLLSDKALRALWERSTDPVSGALKEYDLYGEFGCLLGRTPSAMEGSVPAGMEKLKVKVVELTDTDFFHFGTSAELISSTVSIKANFARAARRNPFLSNASHRKLGEKEMTSPTVLLQSCEMVTYAGLTSVENVWLEGSCLSAGWTLEGNHIVTGVPPNSWRLTLPRNVCVSVLPTRMNESGDFTPSSSCSHYVLRPYGFFDTFKGSIENASTRFLGQSVVDWMRLRHLTTAVLSPDELCEQACDVQFARLFPQCRTVEELGEMLEFMIYDCSSNQMLPSWWEQRARTYRELPRLSAATIHESADAVQLIQHVHDLQRATAAQWFTQPTFYLTDLKSTAEWCVQEQIPFTEVKVLLEDQMEQEALQKGDTTMDEMLCAKRMHMNMFFSFWNLLLSREQAHTALAVSQEGEWAVAATQYHQSCFSQLCEGLSRHLCTRKQSPTFSVYEDELVWGRAPARIDLSGGWTDTPPNCVLNGGSVVNIAITLNKQLPIQVFIKRQLTPSIVIRSVDMGSATTIGSFADIRTYAEVGSGFSIPKAALALAGFLPEFNASAADVLDSAEGFSRLLASIMGSEGTGFEMTLLSAIPAGSGLGTSSIVAGAVLEALSKCFQLGWSTEDVCQLVLVVEQLLTTCGGWQDQYGGLHSGIKVVRSVAGFAQRPTVHWLPDTLFTSPAYSECHLLYYTGITRTAKNILVEIVRGMFLNEQRELRMLQEMMVQTRELVEAIAQVDFQRYGKLIGRAWRQNIALDRGATTDAVEKIVAQVRDDVWGLKLAGAGGGGYLYMVAKDLSSAQRIRATLEQHPPNHKARFVEMHLSTIGVDVSTS